MKKNYYFNTLAIGCFFSLSASVHSFGQNRMQEPVVVTHDNTDGFDEKDLAEKMRADGLTEPVIKVLIEQRRQLFKKGKNVHWTKMRKSNPNPESVCSDAGFENGWGAWMGAVGAHSASGPATFPNPAVNPPVSPNFTLTTGIGIDPCTPGTGPGDPVIEEVAPQFGNVSVRMGEPQTTGCVAEMLTYPLTVTFADTNFTFNYATIIQDAGHNTSEQPYFEIMLLDTAGNTIPYSNYIYIGGPNPPGFYLAACLLPSTYYKPWTTRGMHLGQYVGQTITVVVVNADCAQCGHFAHSYVDFDCDGILQGPRYCAGQATVPLMLRGEQGATYAWETGATTQSVNVPAIADDTVYCDVTDGANSFRVKYILQKPDSAGFTYSMNGGSLDFFDASSGSTSWSWQFPGGTPSSSTLQNPGTITYPMGTYSACLTVLTAAGCSETTCKTFNLSTGINEPAGFNVSVYSNRSQIIIDALGANYGKTEISLYNMIGEAVLTTELELTGRHIIELPKVNDGVYFVTFTNEKRSVTKKIVISR